MRLFLGSDIIGNQKIFPITVTATNATYTGDTTLGVGGNATVTFTAASGYALPSTVTVTGATGVWDQTTGALYLSNVTGDVSVTVIAVQMLTITVTAQNCTYSGDSTVAIGGSASLLFEADTGYELPASVTVSGASYTWDDTTGVLLLSNATANVTISVTATAVTPVSSPIYGVSGLYQSSPALTRTDDAVNMSAVVNSSTGLVSSDFDNAFPWNEAEVKTVNGNKFLQMPDMWFRVGKDSSDRITDIAVSKSQGATGDWYKVDSFYYGCYGGSVSNNKLCSVSGVARQASKTRAEFRAYATANGSGYFQLDLYHKMVMTFLWLIEFANKNSQSIMRGVDNGTARNTGGTDSLTSPSGFNTLTQQMRYHYIEDFIGNYWEFVDGMVWSTTELYVTADPTKFADSTTGHSKFAPTFLSSAGNCLAALGWDDNNPFLCYGVEAYNDNNYTTGFCDGYYYASSSSVVFYSGAVWDKAYANSGALHFSRGTVSYSYVNIGGRLLYKPAS